jgi:hypothetical protein
MKQTLSKKQNFCAVIKGILRYFAKVNGRSTISGPEYVANIRPLCGIKLLSYCTGLKDGAVRS